MKFNNNVEIMNILPETIRNVLTHQLSPEILKHRIEELSKQDRQLLQRVKKELNLKTDEDVINFLITGISKFSIPSDRRLLSNPLMKKIDDLNKVKYDYIIKDFKINCEKTSKDLLDCVIDSLHTLWVDIYYKEEAFRNFEIYKEFEKILFKDPNYRDHFIHQFQVFLTGLPIIEKHYTLISKCYSKKFENYSNNNIDFAWLLCATFHDIGYLLQQFDNWLNSFFKEFLNIPNLPVILDLGDILRVRNFQEYLDKVSSLHDVIYSDIETKWKYDGPHELNYSFRKILTNNLIENRNHGIISSLILLDRIENSTIAQKRNNYKNTTFSSAVMPASHSIALHDKAIFQNKDIDIIDFDKDPFTFILIYSDTIQEWGRPLTPIINDNLEYFPFLSDYKITEYEVSATLTYRKIKELPQFNNRTTFDVKLEEIDCVLNRLKSTKPIFEITLQSKDPNYNINEKNTKCLY
jgi:hypothetical protein